MCSRWISIIAAGFCLFAWTPQSWAQKKDLNCSAANLMLVVDVSGSMSEGGKLEGLKKAILQTVQDFKTTLRLGLISFSGTKATLLVQVGPDNTKDANAVAAHVAKLTKAVQALKAFGTTPMTAAMKLTLDNYKVVIPKDPLHKDPDPNTKRRSFVLLATDGEPTDGNPLPHIKALRSLKIGVKTYDILTFVVGLGDKNLIRGAQLQNFAIQGGTKEFKHAVVPDDLKPFFKDISNKAAKEVCNGRDDDCDGVVDEDLKRKCKNNCGEGRQSCIQGDWSTCDAPSPEAEVCNGRDDDCDGQIDNGSLCPSGKCVPKGGGKAVCEIVCKNGECPSGYKCDKGSQLCIAGPCANKKCKPGEVCSEKTGQAVCQDLCSKVQCPAGQTCGLSGKCIDCYKAECPPQMLCLEGRCTIDPCKLKSCDKAQACVNEKGKAVCKSTCVNSRCEAGEYCKAGSCKVDPCLKVTCDADQVCDRDTAKCIKNQCLNSTFSCGNSGKLVCNPLSGACVDNPCTGVTCPAGSYCSLGECWDNSKPKTLPKGQCNEAKDCGTAGSLCQNGYCATSGNDTGKKGCGCSSQTTTQWPPILLLTLWFVLLFVRRFKGYIQS